MQTSRQDIAYALRQDASFSIFILNAMIILALSIGATTASLAHPHRHADVRPGRRPARLYHIGDGKDCCVEGSPQGN